MTGEIVYRLDAEERFVYFNPGWDAFALANDAPDLVGERLLGRRLFEFITGVEAKHLTKLLIKRAADTCAPVEVTLRCDAPDMRRKLSMVITRINGHTEFRTTPQAIEPRPPVRLLDRHAPRAAGIVTMCAWCNRVKLGSVWVEVEEAVHHLGLLQLHQLPLISHGICPPCLQLARSLGSL